MPKRWCLTCGVLFDGDLTGTRRCPVHEDFGAGRRARAAAGRGSASARGYGNVERRRAKAIVAAAVADGSPCGICGEPCSDGRPVVAHHPDSDAATGDPRTVRLVAAHKKCNDGFRPER